MSRPWRVRDVELRLEDGEVEVFVEHGDAQALACPECGEAASGYGYSWAIRSRLEPIKRVARMLKRHLDGVLNAIVSRVTNARLEGINTVIQGLERSARGFRNRDRFRTAIYFHLGGLDLHPESVAHTNS